MNTLLPVPVAPAISKCGICAKSADANSADQIFAQRQRELRRELHEFRRLDYLAQCDCFAMRVRHFNSDGGFSRDALDQKRFGFERQAKIVGQAGNAAVFDSRLGLEFESGDHRPRIDLRDVALHVEFFGFFLDGPRAIF